MVSVLLEYIILALCLMLLATYYAQNYAGIIGWSLDIGHVTTPAKRNTKKRSEQ